MHIVLNFCPDYIRLMEFCDHTSWIGGKRMLQGLIFTLEKFPLYSSGGELNQLVVGRQWQRGLPAPTCFLSLLPCHPGGCERSPSWAENPLRLVSTRNSHACHPFHCSHAEGPGICPPVYPWDRKLEEDPASRLSGQPAALLPGWPSCPMIGSSVADWFSLQL